MSQNIQKQRIQKVLSNLGYGSRREIERRIIAGEISINGALAQLGQPVGQGDNIVVGDVQVKELLAQAPPKMTTKVLMYHKPEGEITTCKDPKGRKTVFDNLPKLNRGRWVAVGRLDYNTSGLLLFTNNGELANRLMQPKYEMEREYAARVYGDVDYLKIEAMLKGVEDDGELLKFDEVIDAGGQGKNHWYHVILCEGKYREVRRLFATQDLQVSRLIRVRYGHLQLPPRIKSGETEFLSKEAVNALLNQVGLI